MLFRSEKEGVPYVDCAAAWDDTSNSLNLFVINRNADASYPLEMDVRAFEGYEFKEQLELYCKDLEAKNSYEQSDLIVPVSTTGQAFENGMLTAEIKPLSWNVFRFQK